MWTVSSDGQMQDARSSSRVLKEQRIAHQEMKWSSTPPGTFPASARVDGKAAKLSFQVGTRMGSGHTFVHF